jgi:hypothetical protein
MSTIQARTVYNYDGTDYPTHAKAREAWENDVNRFVRERLCKSGHFGPKEQHEVTEALLVHCREAVDLLSLEDEGERDE